MAEAAELVPAYIEAGIAVFPLAWPVDGGCSCGWEKCPSPAKHPVFRNAHRKDDPRRGVCEGECGRLGHGSKDATLDLGVAAEWLAELPEANWGIVPPVGTVVLDIDPRHQGDEFLGELEVENDDLPATLTARTGSGGEHRWFTFDGQARGKLCQGVDLKTHKGYLVAPPSRHMSGGRYEWLTDYPAAPAPRWLQLKLNPPVRYGQLRGPRSTDIDGLVNWLREAKQGTRNDRLFWACCRAAEAELDTTPLVEVAIDVLGCERKESEDTAESAAKTITRKATA